MKYQTIFIAIIIALLLIVIISYASGIPNNKVLNENDNSDYFKGVKDCQDKKAGYTEKSKFLYSDLSYSIPDNSVTSYIQVMVSPDKHKLFYFK